MDDIDEAVVVVVEEEELVVVATAVDADVLSRSRPPGRSITTVRVPIGIPTS